MQHYVGLDVSVKETSVRIVDKTGKVIREVRSPVCTENWIRLDARQRLGNPAT
jgi:predicted NBD/HSP70 family sugar kinase